MKLSLFLCMSSILVFGVFTRDTVLSNNEDESSSLRGIDSPITDGEPAYGTTRKNCPKNMRLYPWKSEKSSWVCDCKPKFLYFSLNDSCHEAYRQGPCPAGHYVNLAMGEDVPGCTENPCSVDGLVPYNGRCYTLGMRNGPCSPNGVLSVDETTFRVHCREISATKPVLVYNIAVAPSRTTKQPGPTCPPGTKRVKDRACMIVWSEEWENSLKAETISGSE